MVSLPAGVVIKTAVDIAAVDFFSLLNELKAKSFNGYLCITIQGKGGLEDGTLVFDTGKIVASFYDYLRYDRKLVGEAALVRVFNASTSKTGVVDIFQLTNENVQLILAFNENAICIPGERELAKFKTQQFSEEFEKQVSDLDGQQNKGDLLKKYKLGDFAAENPARRASEAAAEPPAGEEEDLLQKLKKKTAEKYPQ